MGGATSSRVFRHARNQRLSYAIGSIASDDTRALEQTYCGGRCNRDKQEKTFLNRAPLEGGLDQPALSGSRIQSQPRSQRSSSSS